MNLSKDLRIDHETERAHACLDFVAEDDRGPLHQLVQLSYLQEVLTAHLDKARAEALPLLERIKGERGLTGEQFSVKIQGVLVHVGLAPGAYSYTHSEVFRRYASHLHRVKKGMREARLGRNSEHPPAVLRGDRKAITVHLSGNLTNNAIPDEDIEA